MVLLEPSKKEELDMKRIGSLLTAGARSGVSSS